MLNAKKYLLLLLIVFIPLVLSGCGSQNKLLILNWGEYINEDAVALFEDMYDVQVTISIADSNELFYSKLKSGTTAYDLILPSDYMIEKMYLKDLIQEIDFSKLSNYDPVSNDYLQGLKSIMDSMMPETQNYYVPYFWGTFGLMYNKRVEGLKEALETYQWEAYFNPELRPSGTRVGMYDTPQYAFAAAMLHQNLDPNDTKEENIELASQILTDAEFMVWADDQLKKSIAADNLDLAFVWTGDFLDMLYVDLGDGVAYDEINYDIFVPDNTVAFVDAFVIPHNARHVDLAHEFINFFLDPEIAYMNASVVGYATPLQASYDMIVNYTGDDQWLNDWARAYLEYYEDTPNFKGTPLQSLEQSVVSQLTLMVNNVKTS
ncbi:MAG: ABC transporter substrate-binding protein [Acholeplasmataceae bacterium]|nr:ABC transporter substrate-binding protein [Acholeplasmataceae bacterium]